MLDRMRAAVVVYPARNAFGVHTLQGVVAFRSPHIANAGKKARNPTHIYSRQGMGLGTTPVFRPGSARSSPRTNHHIRPSVLDEADRQASGQNGQKKNFPHDPGALRLAWRIGNDALGHRKFARYKNGAVPWTVTNFTPGKFVVGYIQPFLGDTNLVTVYKINPSGCECPGSRSEDQPPLHWSPHDSRALPMAISKVPMGGP